MKCTQILDPRRVTQLACVVFLATGHFAAHAALLADYRFHDEREDTRVKYTVPFIDREEAPKVDGVLDDKAWSKALKVTDFVDAYGQITATELWIVTDHDYLHLAFHVPLKDGDGLRKTAPVSKAPKGAHDKAVWGGDCVDFTMGAPGFNWQVLISPAGGYQDYHNGNVAGNLNPKVGATSDADSYTIECTFRLGAFHLQKGFPKGSHLPMAIGVSDPNEILQTLSTPYGDLQKAPLFVFGSAEEFQQRQDAALLSKELDLLLYTDRDVYPRFAARGTGRLRMKPRGGGGLQKHLSLQFAVVKGKRDVMSDSIKSPPSRFLDFDLDYSGLEPGTYELQVRLLDGDEVFKTERRRLEILAGDPERSGRIDLTVPAAPVELDAYPVTFGVPFPWGALGSEENVRLVDANGQEVPIQAKVTSRWSREGHVRWLLIDAVVPMRRDEQGYRLEYGPAVSRTAPLPAVEVQEETLRDGREAIRVKNGALQFVIPKTGYAGISELQVGTSTQVQEDQTAGPYMIDEAGTVYYGNLDPEIEVEVEDAGPLKAVVKVAGWHVSEQGERLGRFILRYRTYAGLPHVELDHTFIITADSDKVRYRDIGYALKTWSARGIFGTPRLIPFDVGNGSAYLLQRDDLWGKVVANGEFVEEFGRAEGWLSAGSVAISVRDFWQNFPKEFEVRADRTLVHFWPAHGEKPIRTGARLNLRNVYQCWFAHEGELLDFKAPQEVIEVVKKDGSNFIDMHKNNAMGMAKTHHLLLHFHNGNWDTSRVRSTHRVFQFHPTVVCDPVWVSESKVFGHMAPRDPEKFGATEKAIDGLIDRFIRQQDEDRDYGMWNFGDAHHNWIWGARRWRIYRTWRATHHNWPRWPWLQYARSGSMKLLEYARRNAYHVADISHAHHTDETFENAPYPTGKIVGGICDYKGLVHWAAGNRLGYNSVSDSMLHHYYFTGDRRSLTTALEHGDALLADNRPQQGREGSARMKSLIAMYEHTWDNDYLELLERTMDWYVRMERENGYYDGDRSRATHSLWTMAFNSYVDLTGRERGKRLIRHWADLITRTGEQAMFGHQDMIRAQNPSYLSTLAYCYLDTKDEFILRNAAFRNELFTDGIYEGDDPRYDGSPVLWPRNMPFSWYLMQVPSYLAAVQAYGKPPDPLPPPARYQGASLWRPKIDGQEWKVFYARIKQEREGPFLIQLKVRPYGHSAELMPIGRGGVLRVEGKPGQTENALETIHMEVPADDALEYAFRIHCTQSYSFIPLPIASGQEGLKEVYPMTVAGVGSVTMAGGEPLYFDLPEGTRAFQLLYIGRNGQVAELFNPDGVRMVRKVTLSASGPTAVSAETGGNTAGWSLLYRGSSGRDKYTVVPGLFDPPEVARKLWIAISPDKTFWPSQEEVDW